MPFYLCSGQPLHLQFLQCNLHLHVGLCIVYNIQYSLTIIFVLLATDKSESHTEAALSLLVDLKSTYIDEMFYYFCCFKTIFLYVKIKSSFKLSMLQKCVPCQLRVRHAWTLNSLFVFVLLLFFSSLIFQIPILSRFMIYGSGLV